MSNMKPSRYGSVPAEALSKGSLNEGPADEEKFVPEPKQLDSGPKRGEKGEYRPASYVTSRKNTRTDR